MRTCPEISTSPPSHQAHRMLVLALALCLFSGSQGLTWSDPSIQPSTPLNQMFDMTVIENVAFFSKDSGLYYAKLSDMGTANPSMFDFTSSLVPQNYVLVAIPETKQLVAIGTLDMYIYGFFLEDTLADLATKPTLYKKTRIFRAILSEFPNLTDGFSCKRALRAVNPYHNKIYLSGYPSVKFIEVGQF